MLLPLGYKGNLKLDSFLNKFFFCSNSFTNKDFYFVGCISEEYALRNPISDCMNGKSITHRSGLLICCMVILRAPKFNFISRFSESSKRNPSPVNG